MTSPPPDNNRKIDRAALDRIIQRAAELQTGEREVGDNLSSDEVLALGKEVGIPSKYLQQAMLEHQTTVAEVADQSVVGRLVGPAEVRAQRVVQGDAEDVLHALARWMDKNELMVPQRRQPGWASWEPLRGMQAAIRRGTAALDTSKPRFMLSRAELVVATVTQLESGYSHVTLTGTVRSARRDYLIGAGVSSMVGVGAGGVMAGLGLFLPLAALPVAVGLAVTATVVRSFKPIPERVQLGLERALDFLERGGVKPGHEIPERSPGLLDVLATEVRRALSAGSDHTRRLPGQRPPSKPENKP